MITRIYNAHILTMKDEEIVDGELWVEDNKISYIGKTKKGKFDKEIDAAGNIVMPGFKNAHTHSAMVFARNTVDQCKLKSWLNEYIFPIEKKLNGEYVYLLTKLAMLEYLSSGITACFDMYYEPEAIAKAAIEIGIRTVLCGAINDFKEDISKLRTYYEKYNHIHSMISYQMGMHAEYTTGLSLQKEISKLVKYYKTSFYCHNSETKSEVDECIQRYGVTPTRLFYDNGLYEYGGGGFHCIWLNDEDTKIFKNNNLNIIINSASNMKLVSGIAPVCKYNENGINIGLGTDGAASNNCLNMFKEMYLTNVLQRLFINDADALSAKDVVYMATVGGAKAMGLTDCDVLDVGKKADLIIVNVNKPNMQPINDIYNALVFSADKTNIELTMVDGKIRYFDGEYNLDENIKDLFANVNHLCKKLYV